MVKLASIAEAAKRANVAIDKAVRVVILDVTAGVTAKTPVGTGRAKGNWIPSVDSKATFSNVDLKDTTALGQPSDLSEAIALSNAAVGRVYYLTNNLTYIRRLEYDAWSDQAPNGMVRITLAESQRNLDKLIKQNR